MKIAELAPAWQRDDQGRRTGIVFTCPVCRGKPAKTENGYALCGGRYIPFSNALDGAPDHPRGWSRSGEDLAAITLAPSIWVNQGGKGHGCEWHGFVTGGDVFPA